MRFLLPAIVVFSLGVVTESVLANGAIALTTTAQQARGYASVTPQPRHKLLHRLCHKSRSCEGSRPGFDDATAAEVTMLVQDPNRPCVFVNPDGFRSADNGTCGHCFPQCFTGTPCDCCNHHVRYINAFTPHGKAEAAELMSNGSPCKMQVQKPGPLAALFRKKHFDPMH